MGKKAYSNFINRNQYSIKIYDYATQIGQIDDCIHQMERLREINLLENANVKFNKESLVFAVNDNKGRIYWLERGNKLAGLQHIIERHKEDFQNAYGVEERDIAGFIKNLVLTGEKIAERTRIKKGKITIQQNYKYNGKLYTLNAVGTNGFIVSCYPIKEEIKI